MNKSVDVCQSLKAVKFLIVNFDYMCWKQYPIAKYSMDVVHSM